MATTIALLRGINVGGHRIEMAELRELVESLGCTHVRTLLASGNVIFEPAPRQSKNLGSRLEAAFAERFGFAAPTALVSAAQLARVLAANPLPMTGVNPSRLFVGLPVGTDMASLGPLLAPLAAGAWAPEALALGPDALYVHHPAGSHDAPLSKALQRLARDRITLRNWATMLKLQAAVQAAR